MARTSQLDLPLLAPAQAQKHVTVNEALARLDAAAQLSVVSSALAQPPASPAEGERFLVPSGGAGAWYGRAGNIAVWSNGGWIYLAPRPGWRVWDESARGWQFHDGRSWIGDAVAVSAGGASTLISILEFDHPIAAGTANTTTNRIPAQAQLVGLTGRVLSAIGGAGVTGWRIGVAGADNRYGSGLGLAVNSYLVGLSGAPVTYYAATPLRLTAEGGSFASGRVRLAMHVVRLEPPRAV